MSTSTTRSSRLQPVFMTKNQYVNQSTNKPKTKKQVTFDNKVKVGSKTPPSKTLPKVNLPSRGPPSQAPPSPRRYSSIGSNISDNQDTMVGQGQSSLDRYSNVDDSVTDQVPEDDDISQVLQLSSNKRDASRAPPSPNRPTDDTPQQIKVSQLSLPNEDNIESILLDYGYTPLSKVMVREKDQKSGEFIKTLNPMGIIVYVRLDDGGYITVNSNDLTLIKSVDADFVPYSYKKGAYNSVTPETSGVAIECDKGFCIIQKSNDPEEDVQESNLIYESQQPTKTPEAGSGLITQGSRFEYYTDNNLSASPIISIRDIAANPDSILHQTEVAADRLRVLSGESCTVDIQRFDNAYMKMSKVGKGVINRILKLEKELNNTTNQARDYTKEYLKLGRLSPDQQERYRILLYNLQIREELRSDLVKGCRVLCIMSSNLDDMTDRLYALDQHLTSQFSGVDGIISPK